ncbi:MAG: flagellar biosynthesis protein FlgL, partial [Planctomycetota bacterium]
MTISLNFNASSVLTQFQLSRSEQSLNRVFERLSSGVKLARSADGPGDMVIANALRYQREGVDRSAANAEEGVSMIQTADSSMDQIGSLLTRLRELALNAANDVTQDVSQLQALQSE